ncbi:MAG: hypothetical protein ACKV2Q_34475 [Planctomycetaceae bacterium]
MPLPDTSYSGLAFYGFPKTPSAAEKCYQLSLELHAEAGHQPALISISTTKTGGKYVDFAKGHRRMQKLDYSSVNSISIAAHDTTTEAIGGSTPAASMFSRRAVFSRDLGFFVFSTLKSDRDWLISAAQRICQVLRPAYGIMYQRSARLGPLLYAFGTFSVLQGGEHRAAEDLIADWGAYWWPCGVYKHGYFRDLYEMNFLSQPFLLRTVNGQFLPDWIAESPQRGSLTKLTDDIMLWSVSPNDIPAVRDQLVSARLMLRRDTLAVMTLLHDAREKQLAESAAAAKPKPGRKKLIALLRVLEERYGEEGAERPVVTIDEFFPGNTVDQSIAANLSPHPGLKVFREVLKRIRGKETVQDVLIVIGDSPMLPETDDGEFEDDDWPYSDEVYVLTSSSPAEVEKWAAKLQPDTVSLTHWRNNQPPKGAPELQPGMQLIRLWWD